MKKYFITYKQALDLQKLGFDEPCIKEFHNEVLCDNRTDGENTNSDLFELYGEGAIAAPLKSQVFEWFRDIHNIQAYIYSTTVRGNKQGKKFSDYCWNINCIDTGFINTDARDMENVGYEQAETDCIDKLIEIIKNKL